MKFRVHKKREHLDFQTFLSMQKSLISQNTAIQDRLTTSILYFAG